MHAYRTHSRRDHRNHRDGEVERHSDHQGNRRGGVGKAHREADHVAHREGEEGSDTGRDSNRPVEEVCGAGSRRDEGNSREAAARDGRSIRHRREDTHSLRDEVGNEIVHSHDQIEAPLLGAVVC